jgi:hypothetical protein
MVATATRRGRGLVEAVRPAVPARPAVGGPEVKSEVYTRLSLAIRQGDKERARRIYYDEILPDRCFSRGEVIRLSYRLGAIDEGDRYLAARADL